MAKADLGTKRLCAECGTKFYDFLRDPIVCPKCGTEFAAEATKAAPRAAAKPEAAAEVEEPEVVEDAEVVSLEDAEKEQTKTAAKGPAIDEDFEVEEEELGDNEAEDPFLEDDEDDDGSDVSGIIGGGIDSDDDDT